MTWSVGRVEFRNTLIHECKLVPIIQLRSKEKWKEADYPIRIDRINDNTIISNNSTLYRLNIR